MPTEYLTKYLITNGENNLLTEQMLTLASNLRVLFFTCQVQLWSKGPAIVQSKN